MLLLEKLIQLAKAGFSVTFDIDPNCHGLLIRVYRGEYKMYTTITFDLMETSAVPIDWIVLHTIDELADRIYLETGRDIAKKMANRLEELG